ncbi:uncharacterized protein METZ01_LOCUS299137 [marine metagenome]|uniref:Uncharacterized protein n=1 Tax=marine metagenome TaxID=408172 RepID=A0A382MBC0_9ZZZZ
MLIGHLALMPIGNLAHINTGRHRLSRIELRL